MLVEIKSKEIAEACEQYCHTMDKMRVEYAEEYPQRVRDSQIRVQELEDDLRRLESKRSIFSSLKTKEKLNTEINSVRQYLKWEKCSKPFTPHDFASNLRENSLPINMMLEAVKYSEHIILSQGEFNLLKGYLKPLDSYAEVENAEKRD